MTKVNFYDSINDSMLKFAVIIAIIALTNRAKLEPFDKINAGNPHEYRFSAF